jgi:DNA-binding PadR family transcriptional regulator
MRIDQLTEELQALLPLTPAVFFILFSLTQGKKHGYAMMQEITRLSDGKRHMGPGTLYTTLQRLLELGLVEELPETGASAGHASRRRYYQLTGNGQILLEAEVSRMDSVVRLARKRKLVPRISE